jgi:hypothetical protein
MKMLLTGNLETGNVFKIEKGHGGTRTECKICCATSALAPCVMVTKLPLPACKPTMNLPKSTIQIVIQMPALVDSKFIPTIILSPA